MSRWTPERWPGLRAGPTRRLWLDDRGVVDIDGAIDLGIDVTKDSGTDAGSRAAAAAPPTPAQDFAAWCAAHPGARCRLFVGSRTLTLLTLDPAPNPSRRPARSADLADRARAQLVQVYGAAAADWALLPWRTAAGSGATALGGRDLRQLLQTAAAHRVHLQSVQPAWWVLWPVMAKAGLTGRGNGAVDDLAGDPAGRDTSRPSDAARLLLLDEGSCITVVELRSGSPARVHLRRIGPVRGTAWQADCLTGCGLAADTPCTVLQLPQAFAGAVGLASGHPPAEDDFLGDWRRPRLPWLAAAAAALVALVAGSEGWQAWQDAEQAQDEWQQDQALAAPAAAPGRSTAPPESGRSPAPEAGEPALLAGLGHAWSAPFTAAEAATVPGVQWLGLDLALAGAGGRAELRLEGLAPDLASAQAAAAALAAQATVEQTVLSHLQTEGQQVRFELRARGAAP